jgi:hypothetical protein
VVVSSILALLVQFFWVACFTGGKVQILTLLTQAAPIVEGCAKCCCVSVCTFLLLFYYFCPGEARKLMDLREVVEADGAGLDRRKSKPCQHTQVKALLRLY